MIIVCIVNAGEKEKNRGKAMAAGKEVEVR